MASLADRFAADISLEYSLSDRMRVRGHLMNLQNVGMLGAFFKRWRNTPWIEPRDLQKATDEFVAHVEALAQKHQIPLLQAKPGESHVDQAATYLANVAHRDRAIYCIIKVQEEASSFVSYVPKKEPKAQRKIARGRRRINHVIARLFQRRLHADRTGGRMYRTTQEDYCLKAWHKKTYIKQYNKQGAGLRTETCTHDVREFGTKKGLRNLSYLLHYMDNCNQRLLRWQDTIDQTTVATGFVEKLGQPTVPEKGQRVPGIRLDSQRLNWVLAAVLQFAHVITGFRNHELRTYLQNRFGLSPDDYTAAQLRYDLVKLRAKGWIRKLERSTRYVLTPKGMAEGTAVLKLKECLNGTALNHQVIHPKSGRLKPSCNDSSARSAVLCNSYSRHKDLLLLENQNKLSKISE
jgi:hypothetical protein